MKKTKLIKIKLCEEGLKWAERFHNKEIRKDPHVYLLPYRKGPLANMTNWRFLIGTGNAAALQGKLWNSELIEETYISEETVQELESQFSDKESFSDVVYEEVD